MNKQFQGSKKKARNGAYEGRKRKRLLMATEGAVHNALMSTGDLELMAIAMGVKLEDEGLMPSDCLFSPGDR